MNTDKDKIQKSASPTTNVGTGTNSTNTTPTPTKKGENTKRVDQVPNSKNPHVPGNH